MNSEFFKTETSNGSVRGIISYPHNFDRNKKYPVVFIVYGMAGNRSEFKVSGICKKLPAAEFISVKFDYCGLGSSDGYFYSSSFDSKAEDVIEVFRYIVSLPYVDTRMLTCLTLSDGSQTALYVATKYPEYLNQNFIFWNPVIIENSKGSGKKGLIRPRKAYDKKTLVLAMYSIWIPLKLLSQKKEIDFEHLLLNLENCTGVVEWLYACDDNEITASKQALENSGFGCGIEVGTGGHRLYNPHTMLEIEEKTIRRLVDLGEKNDQ